MGLKNWMKEFGEKICKKEVAVYTTTTFKLPNLIVEKLLTFLNTIFNTPLGVCQQSSLQL